MIWHSLQEAWIWLKGIDFVTGWKAGSILLTGAFGILGLLKDFKNKETQRITGWGYVSLIGIIVSSLGGVAAQFKESSAQETQRQAAITQTLELAKKADTTLLQIQRVLSPISEPRLDLDFLVDCDYPKYTALCAAAGRPRRITDSGPDLNTWPNLGHSIFTFEMLFFKNATTAQRFSEGKTTGQWPAPDLRISADISSDSSDAARRPLLYFSEKDKGVLFDVAQYQTDPGELESNGTFASISDLAGSTVILSELNLGLDALNIRPFRVTLATKEGLKVEVAGPFEKIGLPRPWGSVGYQALLPIKR